MRTREFWVRVAVFTAVLAIPFASVGLVVYAVHRVRLAKREDARPETLRLAPGLAPARVAVRTDGRTVVI